MTDTTPVPIDVNGLTPPTSNELAIVSIMLTQLSEMKKDLLAQMAVNAEAAKGRWEIHDTQAKKHDEIHDEWEKALKALAHRLDDHLRREEDEDLIFTSRVKPIKGAALWVRREWRTLVIVVLLLLDGLGQVDGFLHNVHV